MAVTNLTIQQYVDLASKVKYLPKRFFRFSYDAEADVAYVSFYEPAKCAVDSEFTDDDVIIRYDKANEIVGLTILHASKR